MEASRLINTEEWSVIYSHDLVGCYAAEVRGFLLSLLCNQSGTTLHMYTEDLAVPLDCALERRKREVTCAGTQRRPTRETSLRIDLVESQSTDSRRRVYMSPLVRKISFALNRAKTLIIKYVCVWYYLFTIKQVISAEVLLTVSPWQ